MYKDGSMPSKEIRDTEISFISSHSSLTSLRHYNWPSSLTTFIIWSAIAENGECWWFSRLVLEVKQRAEGTTPPVCHLAFSSLHPPAINLGTDEKMRR